MVNVLNKSLFINTEVSQKSWKKCTSVPSPYIIGKLSYKTEFRDESVSFSESFDPDDSLLIDRIPDYTAETDFGDRQPTPTQKRDVKSKRKARKQK